MPVVPVYFPAADDLGFLWDDVLLEGQTIPVGVWTPSIKIAAQTSGGNGTIICAHIQARFRWFIILLL